MSAIRAREVQARSIAPNCQVYPSNLPGNRPRSDVIRWCDTGVSLGAATTRLEARGDTVIKEFTTMAILDHAAPDRLTSGAWASSQSQSTDGQPSDEQLILAQRNSLSSQF
jgi:hypothetical protein